VEELYKSMNIQIIFRTKIKTFLNTKRYMSREKEQKSPHSKRYVTGYMRDERDM
jgi:hypothetical protein